MEFGHHLAWDERKEKLIITDKADNQIIGFRGQPSRIKPRFSSI
jgi:hypothetical protein